MVDKLTFKEYLDSKEQLREAVKNTPQQVVEYTVRKYCKLTLGEKDDKMYINLKPKTKIFVEWLYEDMENPTPLKINIEGSKNVAQNDDLSTYWSGSKLLQWLTRNSKEERF